MFRSRILLISDFSFDPLCLKAFGYLTGMLPLARALIKKGTIVVMAANSVPSINDVTARELQGIVQAAGDIDSILGRGLKEGILTVVESGNDLPVIDLKKARASRLWACKAGLLQCAL